MDIRIWIFDFLFIEHLTQVGDFSPSVDSEASVDHYNVLKSYFHDINLIVVPHLMYFPNQVFESKLVNYVPRYSYFLIAKPAK
jgi:hypothetical protein